MTLETNNLNKSTSSQGASPANLFPMQESEKEQTMIGISGLKCLELSERLDHHGLLAKTLVASKVWKMAAHLTGYSLTWRLSGIIRNRFLFQLVVSGRGTEGTEFGSYVKENKLIPTASAHDSNITEGGKSFSELSSLYEDVSNPTESGSQSTTQGQLGSVQSQAGSFKGGQFSGTITKGWEYWATEPNVGRVANGIPRRVDRLKGLGNAIVPQVAFEFFKAINELRIQG